MGRSYKGTRPCRAKLARFKTSEGGTGSKHIYSQISVSFAMLTPEACYERSPFSNYRIPMKSPGTDDNSDKLLCKAVAGQRKMKPVHLLLSG